VATILLASGVTSSARSTAAPAAHITALIDPATRSAAAIGGDVAASSDGGFVVVGTTGASDTNAWIGTFGPDGGLRWQREIGCGGSSGASVQQTSDGGYVFAGGSTGCEAKCASGGSSYLDCAWVVRLDSSGRVRWQRLLNGLFTATAAQVRPTTDGGFVVAGSTQDTSGTNDAWVAKLDAAGSLQWQRVVADGDFAAAESVATTADGGYIVSGSTGVIGNSSVLVLKLGSNGTLQWKRTYGTGYENVGYGIQPMSGGYIVAGTTTTELAQDVDYSALLLSIQADGAVRWQRRYAVDSGCGNDTCHSYDSAARAVRPTSDGGYVFAGYLSFPFGKPPFTIADASWLVKTRADGTVVWQRDYLAVNASTGLPFASSFYGLDLARGGGILAVGYNDEYRTSDNIWVVKTDAAGAVPGCADVHDSTALAFVPQLTASTPTLVASHPSSPAKTATSASTAGDLVAHRDC
jgi:hypothetical protein